MGRHNLHSVLVEGVLDVGVKGGKRRYTSLRPFEVGIQLLFRLEIGKGGLQNKRVGFFVQTGCSTRRHHQHFMHLAPGGGVEVRVFLESSPRIERQTQAGGLTKGNYPLRVNRRGFSRPFE